MRCCSLILCSQLHSSALLRFRFDGLHSPPLILRVAAQDFCSTCVCPHTAAVMAHATSPSIVWLYTSTATALPQKGFFQFLWQFLAPLLRSPQNTSASLFAQTVLRGRRVLQNLRQARCVFFAGGLPKTVHRVISKQLTTYHPQSSSTPILSILGRVHTQTHRHPALRL